MLYHKSYIPFILLLFIECNNGSDKHTIIKGYISNLPDGKIYLEKNNGKKIDSSETKNGKFKILMNKSDSLNPFMVSLMHLDNNNNKRFISFHSNKKKHGNEVYLSDFYYGEDVDIKGKIGRAHV